MEVVYLAIVKRHIRQINVIYVSQRTVVNFDNQEWCALKTCMDYNGECYTCDDPGLITLELEDLCSKCPNRIYTDLFRYSEDGISYWYICKIAEDKDLRLRRDGNSFYYYDKNNQLVEEKHLLSDNSEADTLYKYYKNGVFEGEYKLFNQQGEVIEVGVYKNGKIINRQKLK